MKVRGKKSGSFVKVDFDFFSKKIKIDRVLEEYNFRDCFDISKFNYIININYINYICN